MVNPVLRTQAGDAAPAEAASSKSVQAGKLHLIMHIVQLKLRGNR